MKHNWPEPPSVEQIKARAAMIGLDLTALAAAAGVARSTIFRLGENPQANTTKAIMAALETRERAVLRHLIALHGMPRDEAAA